MMFINECKEVFLQFSGLWLYVFNQLVYYTFRVQPLLPGGLQLYMVITYALCAKAHIKKKVRFTRFKHKNPVAGASVKT